MAKKFLFPFSIDRLIAGNGKRIMNNKIGFRNDPDNFDGEVFCKSRVVDPLCRHNGEIKRVSQIEPSWSIIFKEESKPKHYFIKFETSSSQLQPLLVRQRRTTLSSSGEGNYDTII